MAEVVLVTGVSRYLGGRFARTLSTSGRVRKVIGVDVVPPTHDIGSTDFVRADIRNPVIAKVIERAGVDTVVHMNVIATPTSAGGRVSMKEINVIGTMQLLAACQKSSGVRRLVVKSTSSVYGASSKDPAQFTEETPAGRLPRAGWGKDSVEVEGYVRGFSRRRPDVDVAVLRFANAVGPGMRTGLTDYFELPVAPVVLGFDPRLQLVHEDDLVEGMLLATVGDVTGVVNVAGDGVLTLQQALGAIGRPVLTVPPPLIDPLTQALRRLYRVDLSADTLALLTHGRGLDTTRMRADLGLEPAYSTRAAFASYVTARRLAGPVQPATLDAAASRLVALAGRLDRALAGAGSVLAGLSAGGSHRPTPQGAPRA